MTQAGLFHGQGPALLPLLLVSLKCWSPNILCPQFSRMDFPYLFLQCEAFPGRVHA